MALKRLRNEFHFIYGRSEIEPDFIMLLPIYFKSQLIGINRTFWDIFVSYFMLNKVQRDLSQKCYRCFMGIINLANEWHTKEGKATRVRRSTRPQTQLIAFSWGTVRQIIKRDFFASRNYRLRISCLTFLWHVLRVGVIELHFSFSPVFQK